MHVVQVNASVTAAMKAALFALAALLLAGPAFATLGDNGMTTYNGRTREKDVLVFGNQLVIDQAFGATMDLTQQLLTGTYKPHKNDPPTEKKEVSVYVLRPLLVMHQSTVQRGSGSTSVSSTLPPARCVRLALLYDCQPAMNIFICDAALPPSSTAEYTALLPYVSLPLLG